MERSWKEFLEKWSGPVDCERPFSSRLVLCRFLFKDGGSNPSLKRISIFFSFKILAYFFKSLSYQETCDARANNQDFEVFRRL